MAKEGVGGDQYSYYITAKDACSAIPERYRSVWVYHAKTKDPVLAYYCPDCMSAAYEHRKCLTCNTTFVPGCNVKFTCVPCYRNNKESRE